jgi:3-oxoadipate enol-lactonase
MQELISGASLLEVPHAGHLPNLENPEAFNDALDAFLSRLSASPASCKSVTADPP